MWNYLCRLIRKYSKANHLCPPMSMINCVIIKINTTLNYRRRNGRKETPDWRHEFKRWYANNIINRFWVRDALRRAADPQSRWYSWTVSVWCPIVHFIYSPDEFCIECEIARLRNDVKWTGLGISDTQPQEDDGDWPLMKEWIFNRRLQNNNKAWDETKVVTIPRSSAI